MITEILIPLLLFFKLNTPLLINQIFEKDKRSLKKEIEGIDRY